MDNQYDETWFFSTEMYAKELPIRCFFVRQLTTENANNEAVLVQAERMISCYEATYLVLVPKHEGHSLLNVSDDVTFAYVINGEDYKDKDSIDLSKGSKIILDWGGITLSKEQANLWQCKPA